jgi:hypothetical protein
VGSGNVSQSKKLPEGGSLSGEWFDQWPGTKNGRDHRMWLSEPAQALGDVRRASGYKSGALLKQLVGELGRPRRR